jgi:endonuclease YncB( thermonuclease family)
MLVIFSLFGSYSYSISNQPSNCVSTHFDEQVPIEYVIDGDTVILTDKRRVRLIGINTPELSHNSNKPSEVGAELARKSLIQLLHNQPQIQLLYGTERLDNHGRTLAHIFLNNGLNIQAEILRQGLAMPLRIAPNLALINCYSTASLNAKKEKRGLWALSRYKTHNVFSLSGHEKGFYFISGKVKQITESRSSVWINLENNVALRIQKDNLINFNRNDLMSLRGKTVEASGWLYRRNEQLRMHIRHKLDLNTLN